MNQHKILFMVAVRAAMGLWMFACSVGWAKADDYGDSISSATPISANTSLGGAIDYAGDEDYFRVDLTSSGTFTAYTTGSTDTYGYLLNSSGSTLTSSDDNPYPNFNFSYSVSAGTYYIRLRHYSSSGTGGYTLYTSFSSGGGGGGGGGSDDFGNSMSTASSLSLGSSVSGSINYGGDEDYFQVYTSSYGTLTAYTTGGTDTYGYLLDSGGNTLASSDDNPYPNFNFSYSVSPGTYYIRVRHYSISGTGSYTLYTSFSGSGGGGGGGGGVALGDALDNTSLSWTTGGDSSWYGQTGNYYSGGDAAQSGSIGNNQSSYLETTVSGPGTLSFTWRVSSESCCDPLRFAIDGLVQTSIAGETGWTTLSYSLSSGSHTLRWTYSTDGSVLSGSNAGWVDYVQFTATSPPPPPTGTPDILWRHRANGLNAVWFMNGAYLDSSSPILPDLVADLNWNIVGTGDFNNDGQQDLVWQHRTTGVIGIWYMNGRSMQSTALTSPDRASDIGWRIVGVGDFNRDGKPDFLWQHDTTRQIAIWYMNGANLSSTTLTNPNAASDTGWDIMGVGDFNRDGYPDIVWQHRTWDYIAIWYMQNASYLTYNYTTPYMSPNDLNWDIVDTGDFNGDGNVDFFWQHQTTGATAIWYMSNNYVQGWPPFNLYPDSVDWRAQAVGNIQSLAVDTDNDLMSDAWELQFFGNLNQAANGDYDGDGTSNLQEFRNGTSPTLAAPTIRIVNLRSGAFLP